MSPGITTFPFKSMIRVSVVVRAAIAPSGPTATIRSLLMAIASAMVNTESTVITFPFLRTTSALRSTASPHSQFTLALNHGRSPFRRTALGKENLCFGRRGEAGDDHLEEVLYRALVPPSPNVLTGGGINQRHRTRRRVRRPAKAVLLWECTPNSRARLLADLPPPLVAYRFTFI